MPLFVHWTSYTAEREQVIREHGGYRPSFVHRDELPATADGVATRRRNYPEHQQRPSRVSKDRSQFAAENFIGKIS